LPVFFFFFSFSCCQQCFSQVFFLFCRGATDY
jgi:hypothetical protein